MERSRSEAGVGGASCQCVLMAGSSIWWARNQSSGGVLISSSLTFSREIILLGLGFFFLKWLGLGFAATCQGKCYSMVADVAGLAKQ